MKKEKNVQGMVRKVFGNRVLWGALWLLLLIYTSTVAFFGFHSFKQYYAMYTDGMTLFIIVMSVLLLLYVARAEKDFFRGFRIAFSRKRGVSRMELQRSLQAMEHARRAVVGMGIVSFLIPLIDNLYHIDGTEYTWVILGPCGAVMCLSILYSAMILLLLLPVRARLDSLLISYMEEPGEGEEEEQREADGQRVFYGLRALGLTDREAEVARLVGAGMSNAEIGKELYVSVGTVKKHMTHILEKTRCADREALGERIRKM